MASSASCCVGEFELSYVQSALPVMREIEQQVLGCDFGGTGWTTLTQADSMSEHLCLDSSSFHLDIGSGSGWPALYIASRTACRMTLVDMPLLALQQANDRIEREGLRGQCLPIQASGAQLPSRTEAFDSISHFDVLCCLPEKRQMLNECYRVCKPGGLMYFSVIYVVPGLSSTDQARALEAGPPFVDSDQDYHSMLQQTGWRIELSEDVTRTYLDSLTTYSRLLQERESELAMDLCLEEIREQLASCRMQVTAIADGLLIRENFLARKH